MNDKTVMAPLADHGSAYREIRWPLKHLVLAGLHWPGKQVGSDRPPVVMLHGWLDNSLSFVKLAPVVAEHAETYALDLPGHGHSDHRAASQSYLLVDYVADLAELLETHFDKPVDLVAHSLGGVIAMLFAATFPERVRKLVVIDSFGPLSREPAELIPQLRRAIGKRHRGSGASTVYGSLEEAAKIRAGGLSPLSHEAAHALVPRNLQSVDGGFRWRTDARLRHPSMMMFDEAQVLAILGNITTDTLLIRAEKGLVASSERYQARIDATPRVTTVTVPGGHHCHLDGDIEPVACATMEFLDET
ncbi:alpha/beta fold hydrolase [Marinobacter sp. SS21]|uniref:alpha/beta fold hydrolase n=1 Tax=Marinobacter sp. SS21 TaxID=2979460 RepID=UPI002330A370|nr:alpha/beta hydrolase [Marinobacter sp. SS21]MDC0661886.1 alpha/beta hydrolase [Marinobacter sp. SS21]